MIKSVYKSEYTCNGECAYVRGRVEVSECICKQTGMETGECEQARESMHFVCMCGSEYATMCEQAV